MKVSTKIALISFFAALSGMSLELLGLVDFYPSSTQRTAIFICKGLTPDLQLSFFRFFSRTLSYRNFDSGLVLNYINLTLYFVLFLGTLAYVFSRQRETRLLRAFFAVVLLSAAVKLIQVFLMILLYLIGPANTGGQLWLVILIPVVHIPLWGGIAYYILKTLSKERVLEEAEEKKYAWAPAPYVATPKGQRFVHVILDTVLSILICSPMMGLLAGIVLMGSRDFILSERIVFYILIFFSRLIYYLFFELWWGATPAKFLTESRVLEGEGTTLTGKAAATRFFSRYIPFNAFSYLGKERSWPDGLSDTWVVKEKREGAPVANYLLVILIVVIAGWVSYSGYKNYQDKLSRKRYEQRRQEKMAETVAQINQLSNRDLIKLEKAKRSYDNQDYLYLKIEEVNGDEMICKFFTFKGDYSDPANFTLEQYYLTKQEELSTVIVSKKTLLADAKKQNKRRQIFGRPDKGLDVLGDGESYHFEKVLPLFAPHIESKNTGGHGGGSLNLRMKNLGWGADLIKITTLEGGIEWKNSLPQKIRSGTRSYDEFRLRGQNYKSGDAYKFTFTLQDSLGGKHQYLVEGVNVNCKLKKIKTENK
ncbi:hypothetical protein BKI52_34110 [marine bacterium AO1-C]|nr:hypothetical protein BKI52_34110 [marine bacterium AO1-C]